MGRNLPMSFAQETSLWHEKCVCVSVFLCLWYQAFAAKQMRTALIWVIMQWVVVISYWCFGRNYRSHLWGSKIQNGSWTLKMGPIACSETSVINYPTCCVIIQKSTVLSVCVVAHYQYYLSQQSRSLVANSLHESTYCALTRTSIGCCTTMCRVNQNGPTLVQKDNCHYFFSVGWGVLNRKTGRLQLYQFCLI